MSQLESIDVFHVGLEHVICGWQVDDVIVDPGPESTSTRCSTRSATRSRARCC